MITCCGCVLIMCLLATIGLVVGLQALDTAQKSRVYLTVNETNFKKINSLFIDFDNKRENFTLNNQRDSNKLLQDINDFTVQLAELRQELAKAKAQVADESGAIKSIKPKLLSYYENIESYLLIAEPDFQIIVIVMEVQVEVADFLARMNAKVSAVTNVEQIPPLRQECFTKAEEITKYQVSLAAISKSDDNSKLLGISGNYVTQLSKFLAQYANLLQEFEQALASNSQVLLDRTNASANNLNLSYLDFENTFASQFQTADQDLKTILTNNKNSLAESAQRLAQEFSELQK